MLAQLEKLNLVTDYKTDLPLSSLSNWSITFAHKSSKWREKYTFHVKLSLELKAIQCTTRKLQRTAQTGPNQSRKRAKR